MTQSYLESISPDSLSGVVFALEGVARSVVLLNGPTGCKFYHSATSDNQLIRQLDFDPLKFPVQWYFGQPRVPCTYLDDADYVYGGEEKIVEALEFLLDNVPFDLLAIVNSPGAALIGDDLRGIAERTVADAMRRGSPLGANAETGAKGIAGLTDAGASGAEGSGSEAAHGPGIVTIETPGFSSDLSTGYEDAVIAMLSQLGLPTSTSGSDASQSRRPRVNLLGISIFHRNMLGDVAEITRLLEMCGIEVGCALCAGSTVDEIASMGSTDLNIVVNPEFAMRTASYLEEATGLNTYICEGPPVGFEATERMLEDVCGMLGVDATPALSECRAARGRAYAFISRVNSLTGLPKGVTYSIEGLGSELLSWTRFLTGYMGMAPSCVAVRDEDSSLMTDKLAAYLEQAGFADALGRSIVETEADFVFGTGNTIAAKMLTDESFTGIEISLPSIGYYDVVPKTFMGAQGALHLVEMILNGLKF